MARIRKISIPQEINYNQLTRGRLIMSSEIRRKFGLDYLINDRGDQSSSSTKQDKQIELALLTIGSKVVESLKAESSHKLRLHQFVNTSGLELETLLPVVKRLQSLDAIRITQYDKLGNHEIELTPTGMNTTL